MPHCDVLPQVTAQSMDLFRGQTLPTVSFGHRDSIKDSKKPGRASVSARPCGCLGAGGERRGQVGRSALSVHGVSGC